jgi:hypothetical protein
MEVAAVVINDPFLSDTALLRWRDLNTTDLVAVRSKGWTVFARSNARIAGSNPTRGVYVCVRLFCVCE